MGFCHGDYHGSGTENWDRKLEAGKVFAIVITMAVGKTRFWLMGFCHLQKLLWESAMVANTAKEQHLQVNVFVNA
jgi:hypothetical protein